MKAPREQKPGAERTKFRPDKITDYKVERETTLLPYLLELFPDRKRTSVKELLKHNQVAVNGTPTTLNSAELHPGDTVSVNFSREFQTFSHPRVKLVYEDDDIVVVNKGYGLLSVGTERVKADSAYSIVKSYLKRKDPRNKVFIVHRLDQHTSGLMVLAKSVEAKEALQHNWNNMVLERKYLAVVEGKMDPAEGEVRSYLAENSQFEVYSTQDPQLGKLAVTHYRTLRSRNGYSMLEIELATGRKNQIRVHMHDLGHPIAGDKKYGAKSAPIHRMALHAQTLRFVHPIARTDMNFSTPIPPQFAKLVK